jgi:hypothetical protein
MRRTLYPLASTFLSTLCACSSVNAAERALSGRDVLRFDPGPVGSALESGTINLNLDSIYTPTTGYGWLHRPQAAFFRRELTRSRTALTADGLAGERIGFRADIDPGAWYVTIWLETSLSNDGWPQVDIQGEQQTLQWQKFPRQAEPNRSVQKMYRIFHCATTVRSEGLSFELIGAQEQVRLLGVSLIRRVNRTTAEHAAFLQQVEAASHYQDSTPLDELLRQAEAGLRRDPTGAFYAIWRQRLGLLTTAERYYTMRGWQWADAETGLGMFDRQHQSVMLLDGLLMPDPAEAAPLTERAMYFRGRLLHWLGRQNGGVNATDGGNRDLEMLAENYPEDQLLGMYTGKNVDVSDACDCQKPTEVAPAWSNAEREALCRMRLLVHWWVEQRQSDSGELGGKFGDDVEMLRWWAPLCLAGDETAIRGWKRLADGVWQSNHIADGYARKLRDVEHAAEFVSDTTPLMILYSDDPLYEQRLAPSARHFESRWTGTTTSGNRFFRSAWFNSTDLHTEEPKGRDLEYNTRAVQAVRYLAWRHRDPKLVKLLHDWSTAWVGAAMRTDKGKPMGVFPASVRYLDEAFNGDGPNWYQAGMYWSYFEWEHYCGSLLLDQLLFTYAITKDERLLQPMFMSLELIQSEESSLTGVDLASLPEGSSAWVAAKLIGCKEFWNIVQQWRVSFGDRRWDDLIMRHGTATGRYWISADEQHLVDGLNVLLEDLRCNLPLRTTEAVYTDRVRVPGAELLKAMLTGDGIKDNLSPYYSVSWQQTDNNFTALVTSARPDRLEVQLFNHGPAKRQVLMRVWELEPGEYRMFSRAHGAPPHEEVISVAQLGHRIPITLPSQRLLQVNLKRMP